MIYDQLCNFPPKIVVPPPKRLNKGAGEASAFLKSKHKTAEAINIAENIFMLNIALNILYRHGLTFCISVLYPFKLTLLVLADGVI